MQDSQREGTHMDSTDPKAVVIRYIQAARDGMSAVIRDSFAPDATWEYPGDLPLSGIYRGVDAIVGEFLAAAGGLLAAVRLEPGAVIAEGEMVAAEWSATGSSKDGTPYRNRNVGLFTVRDGKIISVREYTDTRHAGQVFFPGLG
jgi:ketosteroid isomerase-like protein